MSTASEAVVRPARSEDYAGVCRVMDMADELHRDRLPWLFALPNTQPRTEAYVADLLQREDSAVFVADAGQLVGVAVGLLRAAPELPVFIQQRWGVLDGLVVEAAWRRRGIGRLLVQQVEAWSIASGAPWLEVNVYDVNPEARRFYEKLGYLALSVKLRK